MTGESSMPVTDIQKDGITKALSQVATAGSNFMNGDDEARAELVASARELVAVAETPVESLLWNIWALVRDPPWIRTIYILTKACLADSHRRGTHCRGPKDL